MSAPSYGFKYFMKAFSFHGHETKENPHEAFLFKYFTCIGVTFLYAPMFQYTKGAYTYGGPIPLCLWSCALHHVACTAQTQGRTGIWTMWGIEILCKSEYYTGTNLPSFSNYWLLIISKDIFPSLFR